MFTRMRFPYWTAAGIVGVYSAALVAFISPWVQRQALYAHHIHSPAWLLDVNRPEQSGFAPKQVTPFSFKTPDNETLYAWHVLPLGVYQKHRDQLLSSSSSSGESFRLLAEDPEARLVISFHGNAGHVAQSYRPDLYRSITGGSRSNVHLLAVDYRGYGLSTGAPHEAGLITDGIAAVDWALDVANIPSERIVLVGHSLGTAVTAGVAEHFSKKGVDFAGVVLVSGFADLVSLLIKWPSYSIGGVLPVGPLLAPFRPRQIIEKWPSTTRIANAVQAAKTFHLHILHARNDWEIPFHHADLLFNAAASAVDDKEVEHLKTVVPTTHGGSITALNTDTKSITREIVPYGGHNQVMTSSSLAMAIFGAFDR